MADARFFIILSFDMPRRDNLHQILVAVVVLGQKNKMEICPVVLVLEFMVIMLGHIHLASDDRLNLRILLRHLQELLHTIHVSMVGDGKCRHSELACTLKKAGNRRLTVKNRILCMDMKMDE